MTDCTAFTRFRALATRGWWGRRDSFEVARGGGVRQRRMVVSVPGSRLNAERCRRDYP
jgi:hypothetical protein